jgi:phosphomannomutase
MAEEKRTLAQLVQDLQNKYGAHYYARLDMHIPNELKDSAISRARSGVTEIGGYKVLRVETLDGVKFFLDAPKGKAGTAAPPAESWLLLRASGTEPLLRVYSEAGSPEVVQQLLKSAESFVYEGELAGTAAR